MAGRRAASARWWGGHAAGRAVAAAHVQRVDGHASPAGRRAPRGGECCFPRRASRRAAPARRFSAICVPNGLAGEVKFSVMWRRLGPAAARTAARLKPLRASARSFMRTTSEYAEYAAATRAPEAFWMEQAGAIDWYEAPTRALDSSSAPFYRWFPDGTLNTCYNAIDRHLQLRADQTAIAYDSAVGGRSRNITYAQLHEQALARPYITTRPRDHAPSAFALPGKPIRWRARGARRDQRRPRAGVHADGTGGGGRDARRSAVTRARIPEMPRQDIAAPAEAAVCS